NVRFSSVPIAALAPSASISPFRSGLRLTTVTLCPLCTSSPVNGLPMCPSDPVSTRFIYASLLNSWKLYAKEGSEICPQDHGRISARCSQKRRLLEFRPCGRIRNLVGGAFCSHCP